MTVSSGGEAIVSGLVAHGVDTVFGLPGAQIYGLFDAFQQAQLKVIGARHEQACGYMAYRLCALHGQTRRVQRGSRTRRAQRRRSAADRIRIERAGAVPDRTGADAIPRQGPRPSARNAGPARNAADLREMGRAHRISRRRADTGFAGVPGNAVGAARAGRAGNAVGRLHAACRGRSPQSRSSRFRRRSPTPNASRRPPRWSQPARRR